jgi:hypothetical protein
VDDFDPGRLCFVTRCVDDARLSERVAAVDSRFEAAREDMAEGAITRWMVEGVGTLKGARCARAVEEESCAANGSSSSPSEVASSGAGRNRSSGGCSFSSSCCDACFDGVLLLVAGTADRGRDFEAAGGRGEAGGPE